MFNNTNFLRDTAKQIVADALVAVKADGSTPRLTVESMSNHVYFYAGVDSDRCLALIRSICDLDNTLRNERLTRNIPDDFPHTPIWLHIQSGGGDLHAGLAVADQLARVKTPIYSVVEGVCASAATLLSMACTKRYILPRSFFMIHQLSSWTMGTYEHIKDDMKSLDMAMATLVDFYVSRSTLTEKKIEELLKHDSWMSATECVKNGMADEILL